MDRQIVYIGAIPQDTDLLQQNKNVMIGFGYLLQAVLGTGTAVDGLGCTPNSPAAMNVLVGPGSIYSLAEVDATAYGSLSADTADQIVKQGILGSTLTFSTPAPATTGQSVVYLIQAAYQDIDGGSTVLPYYNAANPSVAWSGPNNTGTSQNTVRKGVCTVSVKTGVAATTGAQTTPAPDAGFTGLYAVTVANGQTSVTSANIQQLATAPFIGTKLTGIQSAIQAGSPNYAEDSSGTANTITIALSPIPASLTKGMPVRVKVANTNTGPVVMSTNGGSNIAVVMTNGTALGSGAMVANGIYDFTYDANGTRWQVEAISTSTSSVPSGAIMDYAGATAPTGWFLCYGQAISRTTYAALFAAIATTFGVGDGTTTSNLPDYRGRVGAGLDNMGGTAASRITTTSGVTGTVLGSVGGEQTHVITAGESASLTYTSTVTDPGHTHSAPDNNNFTGSTRSNIIVADNSVSPGTFTIPSATTGITVSTTDNAGGGAHNNLQPTIMINKIIKT